VTKPFLPGTGIPYRKSSPFLEAARVVVRVLRSLGGAITPELWVGVALGVAVAFALFDFCRVVCGRALCGCGSVNARLNERKKLSNGPGSDCARNAVALNIKTDIITIPASVFRLTSAN
jgi:hypothetical protein